MKRFGMLLMLKVGRFSCLWGDSESLLENQINPGRVCFYTISEASAFPQILDILMKAQRDQVAASQVPGQDSFTIGRSNYGFTVRKYAGIYHINMPTVTGTKFFI